MTIKCMVDKSVLKKHGMTKLPYFPGFDRVLVKQLQDAVDEKASVGGLIYKPETLKERQGREECRGVLLAAGASGMDHLYSHGIEVGDVVWFSRLAIWRHVSETIDGKDVELMFLRSADLAGSEEHLARVEAGTIEMVRRPDGSHVWRDKKGERAQITPPVDEY